MIFANRALDLKQMLVVEGSTNFTIDSNEKDLEKIIAKSGYERFATENSNIFVKATYKPEEYPVISEIEYERICEKLSELLLFIRPEQFRKKRSEVVLYEYWKKQNYPKEYSALCSSLPLDIQKEIHKWFIDQKCEFSWSVYDSFFKNIERMKKKAILKYQKILGLKILILEFYFTESDTDFNAFSNWIWTESGGGTAFEGLGDAVLVDGKVKSQHPDPTTPNLSESKKIYNGVTINLAIETLIKAKGSGNYSEIRIDDAIKHKKICIYGIEYGNIDELINGICKIFGYKKQVQSGVCSLKMQAVKKTTDFEKVYEIVLKALPQDYIRWGKLTNKPAMTVHFCRTESRPSYIQAVKDFRKIVEPVLEASNGEIDYWKMPQEVHDLFATVRMIVIYDIFPQIIAANSPFLRNVQNTYWSCQILNETDEYFQVSFRFVGKDEIGGEDYSRQYQIPKNLLKK